MTNFQAAGATVSDATTGSHGRHRLGDPHRIHVTEWLTVVRRGFFASLWTPGRHRPVPAPRHAHRRIAAAPAV